MTRDHWRLEIASDYYARPMRGARQVTETVRRHVWVVNTWEELPVIDGESVRLKRTGLLAEALREQGHEVTWWTSSFNHQQKLFRSRWFQMVKVGDGYSIGLVPAVGYQRNASVARLWDHERVARTMYSSWQKLRSPDIIVVSYPTIETSYFAVQYGIQFGIPVIVDVRDQWPDALWDLVPKSLRFVAKLGTFPLRLRGNRALAGATAVTSNGPDVLRWVASHSGRRLTEWDVFFPMAYPNERPDANAIDEARSFWARHGLEQGDFLVVFAGTIGRHFNFDPVVGAARRFHDSEVPVKFVLCGDGEARAGLLRETSKLSNVILPGWVDYPRIYTLLRLASVGIAPYNLTANFRDGITNKPVEYLSASLPILMPFTTGFIWQTIVNSGCGLVYRPDDPSDLAERIDQLRRNPSRMREMQDRADELFNERFSFDIVYTGMVQHIEEVAGQFGSTVGGAVG